MEINPTQQEVLEKAKTLPPTVQEAYFSEDSSIAIGKVMEKNSLSANEGWLLADMVGLVLLGYVKLQDFVPELINRLNISKEKAEQIQNGIDTEIFSSVKGFLVDKETSDVDIDMEKIRQTLRENEKTTSIKDLIANIK